MLEKVITEQLDFRDRKHWEEVDYIHENIEGCMDPMNYYDQGESYVFRIGNPS